MKPRTYGMAEVDNQKFLQSREVSYVSRYYHSSAPHSNPPTGICDSNKTAFVLGYTGEVGKEVVKAAIQSHIFSRLVLIGRRLVKYDDDMYKNIEQRVVDFDKLEDYANDFKGFSVGYSCLGTTIRKAGSDGLYRVDHDYVVKTAKLAKDGGCKQFHLISADGASNDSPILYLRTKGEVENELKAMAFDALYIYRPRMLLSDRTDSRPLEKAAKVFIKPITWAFPTFISVPTSTLAKAMIWNTMMPMPNKKAVEIFGNKDIHKLGVKMHT